MAKAIEMQVTMEEANLIRELRIMRLANEQEPHVITFNGTRRFAGHIESLVTTSTQAEAAPWRGELVGYVVKRAHDEELRKTQYHHMLQWVEYALGDCKEGSPFSWVTNN